ncbi:MAG TPA: hypothetical protein VMU95_23775 [Trebonia sp.]|nr:hypothetical protein [Trebonia sp.]
MTGTSAQTVRPGSPSNLVSHTYSYFSACQDPDGSIVHSGPKSGEGYHYIAPDGTHYQRNWSYNEDGNPTGIVGHGVTGPVVNGKQDVTLTVINHARRAYSQQQTEYSIPGGAPESPAPSLESSPPEVRQALLSGQVTQMGTTTVNGTAAMALSVPGPRWKTNAQSVHRTLYVDARTCQPLRTVTVVDGNPGGPRVADWMPPTPDNIVKAKGDSIPASYKKVDMAVALQRA